MDQAQRDAWNRMLSVLVTGGAAGAGIRGLLGMHNLMQSKPAIDPQSSIPQTVPIHMPMPPGMEEEEKVALFGARPDGGFNAWEIPTGVAAGAGGLMGGWKLVDWLMDKQRRSSASGELDEAKGDYESALQDQYNVAMMSKGASSAPTLDDVYDHTHDQEKVATHITKLGGIIPESWKSTGRDIGHGAAGAYMTALLALTGLSGVGAYKWTNSKSKGKAMERAMKKRRTMRPAPQPIMAIPQYHQQPRPEEDEQIRGI